MVESQIQKPPPTKTLTTLESQAKELKTLEKKLQGIQILKEKQKSGTILELNQIEKLKKETEIEAQIKLVTAKISAL